METRWEFYVTNNRTGQRIETHTSKIAAEDACKICNDHERRHNRDPIYLVVSMELTR